MSAERQLQEVMEKICAAAERAGRRADAVKLLGASKGVSPTLLQEFWNAGLRCFGENRAQELKQKAACLPESCEWHFIGGLQTNKVKDVVRLAACIHSVDRRELIEEIETRASLEGKRQRILLEVNVCGEGSKHGCKPDEAAALAQLANDQPHIEVIGLMTVAPFFEDTEKVRPFFRQLRELRDRIEQKSGLMLPELSMGMSHDFEIAIEEGATMVRVGTALFGERKGL